MKLCQRCHEKPLANIHGRYCVDCREIAKKEAKERAKLNQPKYDKKHQEKQKAQKRTDEVNQRTGLGDKQAYHGNCEGCIYWRNFYSGTYACHYLIDTGNLRGMDAAECYRHEGTPYTPEK